MRTHFYLASCCVLVGILAIQNCGDDRAIAIGDGLSTGDIASTTAAALCAKAEECGELKVEYTSKYSSYSYTCLFDCGGGDRPMQSDPPNVDHDGHPNGGGSDGNSGGWGSGHDDDSAPNNTDSNMPYPDDYRGEWTVTRQPVSYADCYAEMKAEILYGMARRDEELSSPERQLLTDCINGLTSNVCMDPQVLQTSLENGTKFDYKMPPACRYMDEMFGGSSREPSKGSSGTTVSNDPDTSTPGPTPDSKDGSQS
jgi:hypothetical protein